MGCDPWSYGETVCEILGRETSPEARARARWACSADVLRNLAEYRPAPKPHEPVELRPLRLVDGVEEVRAAIGVKPTLGRTFGVWRALVTSWEAENASKLHVLATTLLTLIELRELFEPEDVDKAIAQVGDWVSRVWRVEVPLGQGANLRVWATRKTRSLDLLPWDWRAV